MTYRLDIESPYVDSVQNLLAEMTLSEKIGQLCLMAGGGYTDHDDVLSAIRQGLVGGVLNEVEKANIRELQRVAVKESRLGIPLLFGRDVVHGFKTIFPIPLGLAACWSRETVRDCARASALEAAASGINWTYAPVLDIGRDPRWGRIAETFGEDPYFVSELAKAMVVGFQGDDLSRPEHIAACAKHFVGYGASEAGRDYNTTNIPMNELHNVHLQPFRAAIEAGVASVMTSFCDLDGIPASANRMLLQEILRDKLGFQGMVVSDFRSIIELRVHGLTDSDKESAYEAAMAGVDMEMTSHAYLGHLGELISEGRISMELVDQMVANVLTVKARLGLFDRPFARPDMVTVSSMKDHLQASYGAAVKSIVLLKNDADRLPIDPKELRSLAVIGPMADEPHEQMGTWVFDGDSDLSKTPLQVLRHRFGSSMNIAFARGMETTRSTDRQGFAEAVDIATKSDLVLLFLGEESILSGEAHCRASIRLPGCQEALVDAIAETGTSIVAVVMAGRPLIMHKLLERVDAILYAWHPGSMAGPALVDLLTGEAVPSGRLPVTFPKMTGQIPIYCAHKNTGRPATPDTHIHIDEIEQGAFQTSVGNTSFHLDAGYTPEFPLGFGLSYTRFEYTNLRLSSEQVQYGETLRVSADLANVGDVAAEEVVQLYLRDLVGSVTRPVRQLCGFQRVRLEPGRSQTVTFTLTADDLAFYDRNLKRVAEPGMFHIWIGGSSDTDLRAEFELLSKEKGRYQLRGSGMTKNRLIDGD